MKPDDTPYPADTLGMDVDEMRRLGYRVVDEVINHLSNKHRSSALSSEDPQSLSALLGGPIPEDAQDADKSLELLINAALHNQQHGDHPRYFARVPGPSSFAAVLGEWLGVGFNTIAASWGGGAGPSTVELIVIDWLRQLMGLPEGYEGVLVSGGSHASLTAFAAVRALRGNGAVYLTDQTHSSLGRALLTLGFGPDEIRTLPSDADFRMCPLKLREAIEDDRRAGKTPLMVVGTAGTTNTGAVDPLLTLAEICKENDLWFHIDGAYGAPAALSPVGLASLAGLERADSLVLDPHKWLFQPYDAGCLLIRPGVLEACFSMNPEYLQDVRASSGEIDLRNRGFELSRRSRALKLWYSMRTYGLGRFRKAITHSIELAEFAEQYLREQPERWQLVTPAQLGILCFALNDHSAEEHKRRAKTLSDTGFACVTTSVLKGQTVFRLCIINPLTTQADITETIDRLAECGSENAKS